MNKTGSTLFVILMAVVYFMFGMIVYQYLKTDIDLARGGLSCSATETAGDRFTCLIFDGIIPIVIITILSGAGGYITEKVST